MDPGSECDTTAAFFVCAGKRDSGVGVLASECWLTWKKCNRLCVQETSSNQRALNVQETPVISHIVLQVFSEPHSCGFKLMNPNLSKNVYIRTTEFIEWTGYP